MNIKEQLKDARAKTVEWLEGQEWFQEIKEKWEELDPQARQYIQYTGLSVGAAVVVLFALGSYFSSQSIKSDFSEKTQLVHYLDNVRDELKALQAANRGAPGSGGAGGKVNWSQYLRGKATSSGMSPSSVSVSPAKKGKEGPSTEESLYEIETKKVNIKQVIRYAYELESGREPVKLRRIVIDTDGYEGYLNARLFVSAFKMKEK